MKDSFVPGRSQPKIDQDLALIKRYRLSENRGLPSSVTVSCNPDFLLQLHRWTQPGGLLEQARKADVLTYEAWRTIALTAQSFHRQPLKVREAYLRIVRRLLGYQRRIGFRDEVACPRTGVPVHGPAGVGWGCCRDGVIGL